MIAWYPKETIFLVLLWPLFHVCKIVCSGGRTVVLTLILPCESSCVLCLSKSLAQSHCQFVLAFVYSPFFNIRIIKVFQLYLSLILQFYLSHIQIQIYKICLIKFLQTMKK